MNIAIIGAVMVIIAVIGGILFVRRHTEQPQIQVKMVLFGLYFWGLIFVEIIILALAYALNQKFHFFQ
ncbi:hypothetical protein [Methylobacter sp. YRD-M1]|uniref:hypothetical protein n=1 Tax=Methylobacter sp. YRD-M1 TaxID=2911520 RepID=UPI00227B155F|nr:hypothetical protein [Methylobacter sp. YRD-M1]WAK00803.1 hypothetical protein LZ558_13215 [Methylobacter sp. YRD-M1]